MTESTTNTTEGTSRLRLRVLHLAKFYPPVHGGMERVLETICESTQPFVENHVLAAHTARRTVQEVVGGIPVTRAGCLAQAGSVAICPTFPWWRHRLKADVAVVHEPNATALVADWLAMSHEPLVVWFHADLVRPSWKYNWLYRPFLRRALRRASAIIVSSPIMVARAEGLAGFRDKCVVVPYGVDPGLFAEPRPVPAWLASFVRRNPSPFALMVGRLVPYKGVDDLLTALAATTVPAVIVGDGPELARLRVLAAQLGLCDRVLFPGSVTDSELVAAYQQCGFFVLPSNSRQEAFGMVQLEAMACGKAVISTELPTSVPWVNLNGVTGLVVPPGDPSSLRAAIDTLAFDDGLRGQLGTAGSQRVREQFTIDAVAEGVRAIYEAAADWTAVGHGARASILPAASDR